MKFCKPLEFCDDTYIGLPSRINLHILVIGWQWLRGYNICLGTCRKGTDIKVTPEQALTLSVDVRIWRLQTSDSDV